MSYRTLYENGNILENEDEAVATLIFVKPKCMIIMDVILLFHFVVSIMFYCWRICSLGKGYSKAALWSDNGS